MFLWVQALDHGTYLRSHQIFFYYLWNSFFDRHSFSDYWDFIGYTDNKKGDLHEMSMNLIKNYWEVEAKDSCLDHFHVISMEGLLKVRDIKSISRSVW